MSDEIFSALGDRLRSTPAEGGEMNPIGSVLQLISEGLNPAAPTTSGPLTLIPLFGGLMSKPYLVGADAFTSGSLTISEVDRRGDVTHLEAHNRSTDPVFLMDGEHLEGAKQNRILNASVLLGAGRTTTLPVACVEQGRWSYEESLDFSPSSDIAYGNLRSKNAARRAENVRGVGSRAIDQSEVWDEVELMHTRLGSASATGAMKEGYDHRRGDLDEIKRGFNEPEPGQTGVVACVDGRPVALDAFDRPETFSTLWPRLLSAYSLDALGRAESGVVEGAVEAFFGATANAHATCHEGLGLGIDVVLTSPHVVGNALTWEEGVVHLALFIRNVDGSHLTHRTQRIQAPSQRAGTRETQHWGDTPPRWS